LGVYICIQPSFYSLLSFFFLSSLLSLSLLIYTLFLTLI
jgi:hypothetical protein